MTHFALIYTTLDFIARAGGGGSSSGGGGSGGGGDLGALVIAIGYFPSYYLGKLIKKLLPRKAELTVSVVSATIFSVSLILFGGSISFIGGFLSILVVIGVWMGWAAAFFGAWDRLAKRINQARNTIKKASKTDPTWNEQRLLQHGIDTFTRYQQDWSTFNLQGITSYTTQQFAQHTGLLLRALQELGRTNRVSNVQIIKSAISQANDDTSVENKDSYTVTFEARALDQLIDASGTVLFTDNKPFIEHWTFVRDGANWLLSTIKQETASRAEGNPSLTALAQEKNMFYSLDMGWLLIPQRGIVTGEATFGRSDINNHIIGYYKDHLFQIYTYKESTKVESRAWLIVQLTLPKSYSGIIVQKNPGLISKYKPLKPPKNYTQYTYEWPEFNKRYTVHAAQADRLASFELINPGFMTYLYDNDPEVGIEVADSTLYLFKPLGTQSTATSRQDYETMFTIALKAFKELRL